MFKLDGGEPTALRVVQTNNPTAATPMYSVVADHGWAERILCSECYDRDANAIARLIADALGIPCRYVPERALSAV